jgi:hypothetical protein
MRLFFARFLEKGTKQALYFVKNNSEMMYLLPNTFCNPVVTYLVTVLTVILLLLRRGGGAKVCELTFFPVA